MDGATALGAHRSARLALMLLLLAVTVTVTGCGQIDEGGPVTLSSTVPVATTDVTTTTDADTSALVDELGLPTPIPIDRPDGFPELGELATLADRSFVWEGMPYPRARLKSGWRTTASIEQLERANFDMTNLGWWTFTYFDGLEVVDTPSGHRSVTDSNGRFFYLSGDGRWVQDDSSEMDLGEQIARWDGAQFFAASVMTADPQLAGFALIADTPTAHILPGVTPDERELQDGETEIWLDKNGVALRVVHQWTAGRENLPIFLVWSIESLEPTLSGPLPPDS
jgi:hypothetical protein